MKTTIENYRGGTKMKERLQELVNGYGIGMSKEELVSEIYWAMASYKELNVVILNEKYLIINGTNFQFIKSKKQGKWIVKTF